SVLGKAVVVMSAHNRLDARKAVAVAQNEPEFLALDVIGQDRRRVLDRDGEQRQIRRGENGLSFGLHMFFLPEAAPKERPCGEWSIDLRVRFVPCLQKPIQRFAFLMLNLAHSLISLFIDVALDAAANDIYENVRWYGVELNAASIAEILTPRIGCFRRPGRQ